MPRLHDELRRLQINIDKLNAAIRHSVEEAEQTHLEREKLLQEQWRLQRESATHRRNAEDYEELQTENEKLTQSNQEVKNTLHAILQWSKEAATELRR